MQFFIFSFFSSLFYCRKITDDTNIINERSLERKESLKEELFVLLDQCVLTEVDLLFAKNAKLKNERAKLRLKNIQKLHPVIKKMTHLTEVIWFAFCLDYEKFNKNLEYDNSTERFNTLFRIELMQRLISTNRIPIQIKMAQDIIINVIQCVTGNDSREIGDLLNSYHIYKQELMAACSYVTGGSQFDYIRKGFENLKVTEKVLENYIFSGATSQPQLHDPQFFSRIERLKGKNIEIEEKINEVRNGIKRREKNMVSSVLFYRKFNFFLNYKFFSLFI